LAAGVVDTGGNFAAGVVMTLVANLPPVSLIPMVHLGLRIFPRTLELPPVSLIPMVHLGLRSVADISANFRKNSIHS
jgi:hypothetical protein